MRRLVGIPGPGIACLLIVGLALAVLSAPPAPAAQRMILGEDFTATWCIYCPIAGRALHRLMNDYPTTLTYIQIHGADAYEIPWGTARKAFYGTFEGYPTVWFDGLYKRVGVYETDEQTYNWYKQVYLTRINIPTDVWIEVGAVPLGGQTFRVTARVGLEVGTAPQRALRIHMVHALDYFPYSSDYRYRMCVRPPSVSSEDITLPAGTYREVSRDFTFDATSWAYQNDIRIVVWAQTPYASGPASIFNTRVMRWPFAPLPPTYSLGDVNCDGAVNTFDIDAFVLAGTDPDAYVLQYPDCDINLADCNQDGQINTFDIDAFVRLLTP